MLFCILHVSQKPKLNLGELELVQTPPGRAGGEWMEWSAGGAGGLRDFVGRLATADSGTFCVVCVEIRSPPPSLHLPHVSIVYTLARTSICTGTHTVETAHSLDKTSMEGEALVIVYSNCTVL